WPPPIGIVKVGYTAAKRYRKFVLRGAKLRELLEFPTSTEAFDFEERSHDYLREHLPLAFANKEDARPYLGSSRGVYFEWFAVRKEDMWLIDGPISSWTSGT